MFKIIVLSLSIIVFRSSLIVEAGTVADSWVQFTRVARVLLRKCSNENITTPMTDRWRCFKNGSLNMMDQMMESSIIPLTDNVLLIRKGDGRGIDARSDTNANGNGANIDETKTWSQQLYEKIDSTLSTHVLQIDLSATSPADTEGVTGRNRRRNQMMPMMMFGITLFGMFFVPLGFQFLSVLGGKAFLMAKLALILASINGLKRVASSGVHYGLYHTPTGDGYYGGAGPRNSIQSM